MVCMLMQASSRIIWCRVTGKSWEQILSFSPADSAFASIIDYLEMLVQTAADVLGHEVICAAGQPPPLLPRRWEHRCLLTFI